MLGILGKKIGMTAIFDEDGRQTAVTVIDTRGNVVVGTKTEERDGYNAVVLGYGERRVKNITQPELGQFRAAGLVDGTPEEGETVKRHLREFRLTAEQLAQFTVGQTVSAIDLFKAGEKADVVGTSKGRGFTGVMKRHNFKGFKATHGAHEYFRHGGAISSNTYPARVFKNKKMPGQHGNARSTIQNLLVAGIMEEEGLVLIKGGVPGPNGGLLQVKQAIKVRRT